MQIFSLLIFAFLFLVSLNKTPRQNSLFAVLQYSESFFLVCRWSGKRYIIFINYKISVKLMFCIIFVNKCASLAAVWCSFDSNLCSLIFYSCSLSSYLCYPLYLFPSTNIFCLYPPHPISRYFCKESLMTPPPPQHTSPLQVSLLLLLPLQKFSS